jgi:hypothetical protein
MQVNHERWHICHVSVDVTAAACDVAAKYLESSPMNKPHAVGWHTEFARQHQHNETHEQARNPFTDYSSSYFHLT